MKSPLKSHTETYTDEQNTGMMTMDALGRVNAEAPTTIHIDATRRVFYTSPTKTIAGTKEGEPLPGPPVYPDPTRLFTSPPPAQGPGTLYF